MVFIGRVVASLHLLRLRRHAPQMWSEGYAFQKGRFALTFGKTQCSHLVKGVASLRRVLNLVAVQLEMTETTCRNQNAFPLQPSGILVDYPV